MGTFHHDHGPLHGITVAVRAKDGRVIVGRCHELTDDSLFLVGADVHEEGAGGVSGDDYLRRAAELGYWERLPRLVVPVAEIDSLRPLGEVAAEL